MGYLSKRPFESIVLLLVLYYSLSVLFLEPVKFSVKFEYIFAALGVWLIFLVFGVGFKKELERAKNRLTNTFTIGYLVLITILIFILTSLVQYAVTSIFVKAGSITIGFPYYIYSFSANKFSLINLFLNLLISFGVTYFVGNTLMKSGKRVYN